jgi:hypothetical protein
VSCFCHLLEADVLFLPCDTAVAHCFGSPAFSCLFQGIDTDAVEVARYNSLF